MIDVLRAPKKVIVRKFRSLANPAVQLSRAAKKEEVETIRYYYY